VSVSAEGFGSRLSVTTCPKETTTSPSSSDEAEPAERTMFVKVLSVGSTAARRRTYRHRQELNGPPGKRSHWKSSRTPSVLGAGWPSSGWTAPSQRSVRNRGPSDLAAVRAQPRHAEGRPRPPSLPLAQVPLLGALRGARRTGGGGRALMGWACHRADPQLPRRP
jgi:hypothetical protein